MYFSEWVSNKLKTLVSKVLILIMLDVLLGDESLTIERRGNSLNPYYVGCTSRSNKKIIIMIEEYSLNPYYVGCTSRRDR